MLINYDEIDEQYGITPVINENKSINNLALSNVQTVPNELEQEYNEVYSAPEWFENLHVCSEDEIKEWQAMGPMGIAEAWERNNKWASFVPYVNTTKDAAEAVNVSVLLKRLKDGKDLTEKQMDVLVDYLRDVKEQQVRGYSFAGGVVNAALTSIPYMEEFGIGLWTSGIGGIGLAPLSKTLTTIGAKKAAKKAVQKAMQEATMKSTMTGVKKNLTKQEIKKIYDDAIIKTSTAKALGEVGGKRFATETAKALPKALTSSAKLSLTKMPQNFVGNIADRQISSGIYVTDAGQGIFTNSENLALSTMKALGDSTFEALTETSGFLFAPISRYFAKPIRNALPKKFYTAFDKLVSTRYGMKTTKVLKEYGYDGILEEMGEEQLNRFLTDVFGSNGVQGYTLDGFLNNVFYFDREGKKGVEGLKTGLKNAAKGYATEALSFALAGAGARGAVGSVSKISDRWNQKKLNNQYKKLANYSLNEFYLDQGFIKIKGSQSSAELALRHRAEAMGIDKTTIDEYCQLSSENEIRAKLQELILNENATIDTEKIKVEKQAVEELKNTYFNQLKNTGVDEIVANQTADLYAYSFAKLAKDNGISIKDIPEANIDFRKLTPEQAIEQVKQGFKDNTQVKFQKHELPKYIEEDNKIAATNRHYEGGETSPKINKILDFVREGNSLEATVQKFQTKDFDDGRITKIYNDFQNGVYKYVEGTSERIEKKKVLNPEYVPLFNGTEEKTNEIIEHYEENTSTDTVGHGYSGYSMSNNAKNAYEKGSMPLSKWNKKNIIERIKNIVENYDIPFDVSKLDKMTLKDIKDEYLKKDGYHHTSKFYNTTNFYKVDIEKILENKDNTQVNKTEKFASFEELHEAFKNDIEEAPEDYEISDLNEALKDLGITENKPLNIDTPIGDVEIRKDRFEHIFNGGGDGHLPDKKRYKSINKMILTLKNPTLIVETETEKKNYIKLFKTKTGSKNQVAIVYNDKNGDFIYTSMPVDKDKKYLLNRINNSTIIYKKGQSRVAKSNSAANNSITNSDTDFKSDVIFDETNPNIYYQEEIKQKDDINKRTDKSKYLTDNEVAQLEKDKQNFETYISKLINGELSHRSQIRVLEHLPSAYNNIPELKGKKVVVTQDVYKKIIDLPNRFNKNHNIDRKRALKLPQFISDPLYILQSISEGNEHRFIVVTNSKGNKPSEKLSIILNPNNNVAVVSAYDEKINISEEKKNNRVLYDKKKELSKTILTSEARAIDNSNNSIANSDTDFKSDVIFDETNPNIYYQSMISGINPKQKVDVIDLTNNFSTDKNLSRKDLSDYIKTLIGKKLQPKDKKAIVEFVKRSKRIGKNDVYVPDHIVNSSKVELNNKGERNTFVNNLTNLITNSVFIDKEPNNDKTTKPNVDNYLRFYVPVKINNDVFTVRITAENNTSKNLFNILNADVYDVIIDKKMPTSVLIPANKQRNLMKSASNSIITPSQQNSSVEQITIEEMLKDVKAPDGKVYFQNDDDSNIADTEKGIMNAKGFFYEKTLFDGTLKDNIMVLIDQKADASTLVHEFGHIYLQALNRLAKTSPRAKEQLLTVNKWLRFDGNEYTEAQHEKFANGFIAYVKSGKAPSYGLKRVFENFRRWLSDIYNNFITSETVELDEETQKVFDELLGDLSVNQQEKLSEEIIQKAKDNASLRMRDEEVEKGKVKFNELTDKQRRYRDTAYEIVYYALKHSKNEETRNYVQNISDLRMKLGNGNTKSLSRQFERIELLLAETEDAFSANDGFLPEWGEFFNDTGVSYDNIEQGADAELAMQAFEVIRDKKYLTAETFEELSENEIKKAQYELEYIINEYRNSKDKSIPMSAFYDWLDTIHPYIQENFLQQWENQTNEIDRYQAMSKFEQAKEDLKLKAAQMQGFGNYSWQFAEYAREIIKRLDFMTEKDKAKIFDKLKDFNSFREIQKNLDDVMDFAQTLYNVTERRKIADDIIKEVDRTIHEWQNGIKRTKYTYPANKLFTRLRTLNNMRIENIKDLYDAQVNEEIKPTYEADAVHDEDYYETIEKMFIEFKANGVYYNSTEFLQDLLNRIQTAKYTAKVARDEIDFERKMQAVNLIDEAAKAVSKHTGKVSKLEKAYRYGFNLDSALEMMFDKSIKQKFSLDYLYAQKDAKVGADRDEVLKKLKENFGYKGAISDTLLFNRFIDMTKKEFDIYQRYTPDIEQGVIRDTHRDKETGKTVTDKTHKHNLDLSQWAPEKIKLSRMEALYFYIQSLNDESYKILTDDEKGQFDRFEFDSMINKLTAQEKMMGIILQQAAEKYYDDLNRYHIRKYHTELGKVKNYFPRKTEMTEVKPLELFSDYVNYSGVISAQKQRTAYKGARIAPANPVAVLFDHIEKANTLIIMGEQLDLMNRVFKEQNLKKKIEAVWGIDTAREFYNQIAGNLYSGQASMISEAEREIGRWENNVIKAQIFAKAQVGLKQIISFMNYGTGDEYVSTKEWTEEFLKQSLNIKEWKKSVDYMMNIPYLKDRFGRGGSTDALKRQLEQKMFAKISLLDDFFSLPIKVGDVGAIVMGGKPYIDVLLKKGYTEEQALKIFIEKTVNEMQSSIPSTLANMQRNASKSPLTKMLFAYQNTPWQYFRVASNSIIRLKQNPNQYTGLNMVKLVGLYMYVFPLIFNLASSLSPITGDEEELKSDLWKSIIGGVTFVPIAYQFVNAMLSGILGERVSSGNWFDTAAVKAGNLARKASKGEEITPLDVIKTISLFGEMFTGVPLVSLETEATGIADIATGKPVKGIAKVAGYSDYRSRKIAGEE